MGTSDREMAREWASNERLQMTNRLGQAAARYILAKLAEEDAKPAPNLDWPEDSSIYHCLCSVCREGFFGNKGRVLCRVCAEKQPKPAPSAADEKLRYAVECMRDSVAQGWTLTAANDTAKVVEMLAKRALGEA